MKIGIKFCGHCAPRTDMMRIYKELCEAVPEWEYVFFVRDQKVDVLLVLNACHAQCASVSEWKGPVIVVSPDSVDQWTIGEQPLCQAIIERIKNYE